MSNIIQKSINLFVAAMLLAMLSAPVFAGAGHDHAHEPISKEKAGELASKNLEKLVEKGKIDKSWSGKPVNSVEKKSFSKGPEWVVTFKNESLADASKRTLYMFYTLDGHYLATNYTGN
ncbi:DUF6488 family protein [Kaarinaea lacus]